MARMHCACPMCMNACFCDFLSHMQWIEMILVPNDRSSLDLHFGILHVIFGGLCGVLACFATRKFTVLVHSICELCLVFSCDPLNGSLWFLSQIVDHLEIFIWVCGLCGLVGCAGTGYYSHFGWFLGRPILRSLYCLVRYANLFRYADFT